jgi:hypothetical protein
MWIATARDATPQVRERFGADREREVLAEIAFYERLLQLLEDGDVPPDPPPLPSPLVLKTLRIFLQEAEVSARDLAALAERRGEQHLVRQWHDEALDVRRVLDYVDRAAGPAD